MGVYLAAVPQLFRLNPGVPDELAQLAEDALDEQLDLPARQRLGLQLHLFRVAQSLQFALHLGQLEGVLLELGDLALLHGVEQLALVFLQVLAQLRLVLQVQVVVPVVLLLGLLQLSLQLLVLLRQALQRCFPPESFLS
jgi:hypothetical protein